MKGSRHSDYQTFCIQREKDLKRVASHSLGGHDLEDVTNEAWTMAAEMRSAKAIAIDWLNPKDQNLLLTERQRPIPIQPGTNDSSCLTDNTRYLLELDLKKGLPAHILSTR